LSRYDLDRGIVPGVELAWRLAFDQWGNGYATEAARAVIEHGFSHTQLDEIIAVTNIDNERSRRVMVRLGMLYSPQDTFEHPLLPVGDLRTHVVYRLGRAQSLFRADT
jgi:RimJ/RimL family protein N-acetyltransferase